jgi:hypothetical protein
MVKWLKALLFVIWGLLLIPLFGAPLQKWLAENVFSEPNAVVQLISDQLARIGELSWFKLALIFMTGLVIGISLETSARRSGERKAFALRSLGYRLRSLSDALKARTASAGWPDNARDLKPAITSVLISAGKFGVWTPNDRIYELQDASFLCEYFGSVGKLLENGQLEEARGEALSWRPFLDRTKPKSS